MHWRLRRLLPILCLAVVLFPPARGVGQELPQALRRSEKARPIPRDVSGLPAETSLDRDAALPVVRAKIGETSLRLLIDTGATWSILTADAAERAGLTSREATDITATDAAGETRGVRVARVAAMELEASAGGDDPLVWREFDVAVFDARTVGNSGTDGIIGLPLLRRLAMTFNPEAGTVRFSEEAPASDNKVEIVRLRTDAKGHVFLPASFGEQKVMLLFDTGFSSQLLLPEAITTEIGYDVAPRRGPRVVTGFGEEESRWARLAVDGEIGPLRLARPIVMLSNPKALRHAVLGWGFLGRTTFTLDFPRRRLVLEGEQTLASPPLWVLGFDWTINEGVARVGHVVEDSSAALAGIRVGDELVSVAGVDAAAVPTGVASAAVSRQFGDQKTIAVVLRRDGRPVELQVAPTVLIP